jgi:hypothetical protein
MADTGKKIFGYFRGRTAQDVSPSLCDTRRYEFQELQKATNKFKSLIMPGVSGDLGSVYKVKTEAPFNYFKLYVLLGYILCFP